MNTKTSPNTKKSILATLFVISLGLFISNHAFANKTSVSISVGQPQKNISELDRNILLEQTKKSEATIGMERQQFIAKLSAIKTLLTKSSQQKIDHDSYQFAIFNAQSALLTDDDFDGYYQGFSITFDADYLRYDDFDTATVYAEMYLSKNGGPWLHYFTTDAFTIHSDDPDDDYEVITTLVDGYNSDNYDVLIDLYEVGYSDIVTTYSSSDSNALYALPLESANNDIYQPEQVSYSVESGGSFSWLILIPLFLISLVKNRKTQ
ncbi:MAG: hypothetical protein COB35_07230 [Gammaproteobacteria bacterium]|nr:MAG: hypothetical protein COB35_07230 [Gammaproteobacteria bacterium]